MTTRTTPLLTARQVHLITFGIFVCLVVLGEFYLRQFLLATVNDKPKTSQDFIAFYAASAITLDGDPASVYNPSELLEKEREIVPDSKNIPWFYPPTYLSLISPLALTDYLTSRLLFFAAGLALFLYAAHQWMRWPGGLFAVAAFGPVFANFSFGQNGLFTASFILLALLHMERKPWLAGLFIGLLAIKPHLGVLIPIALLAGRQYRVFLWATIFTAAFVMIANLQFGSETWLAFIDRLDAARDHLLAAQLSLPVMISTMANLLLLGASPRVAFFCQAMLALPFIVVMIRIWRHSNSPYLRGASLGLATLMCSPYLFDYDLTWMALPIGLLALHARQTGWLRGESAVLCVAWALPLMDFLAVLAGSSQWFPYNVWLPMNLILLWLLHRRFTRSAWQNALPDKTP